MKMTMVNSGLKGLTLKICKKLLSSQGSKTHLQMGEYLNDLIKRLKD